MDSPAALPVAPPPVSLPVPLVAGQPWVVLAPMQDICSGRFMDIVARRGAPDWFVTEFFRVHETSVPDAGTLARFTQNDTGRPLFVQLIGEHVPRMAQVAALFSRFPVAGIELNLGCPAPQVFRKNVGGGLLRDLPRVDALLGAMRDAIPAGLFSVKTRIAFDDAGVAADTLGALVDGINRHSVDLLTVHGRTVRGLYRSAVDYGAIAGAVRRARCPVMANGDISSAEKAAKVLETTGCAGLMVGRHAVRNPWIFRQIREHLAGSPVFQPRLADVRAYVDDLATAVPGTDEIRRAASLKKFLNFVGTSVDAEGKFLFAMRRAPNFSALMRVCDTFLLADGAADQSFPDEPFAGLVARPNCEA
ncbi:MAG: tRNA-dihydrouridine synthase family protein [Puniceicoccales bacterium]|jgi:tRNA-dihydrouridine synthase|nr:tRNA-dihydrouridine synthase family protein [Puniceicoccales bacterium]